MRKLAAGPLHGSRQQPAAAAALDGWILLRGVWNGDSSFRCRAAVPIMRCLELLLGRRSTPIRLHFDRVATILRYGLPVLGCCTAP